MKTAFRFVYSAVSGVMSAPAVLLMLPFMSMKHSLQAGGWPRLAGVAEQIGHVLGGAWLIHAWMCVGEGFMGWVLA